jgi:TonB family protein
MKAAFYQCCPMRSISGKVSLLIILLVLMLLGWNSNVFAQASGRRQVLLRVEPDYPEILRTGQFEGQVRLEATVLENGSVSKVEVKGGSPMFARYAKQALEKWKYAPGSNRTVEEVVFNFHSGNR